MATNDRRIFSFFTSLGIRYTLDLQPAWRGQMRPAISHSGCFFCVGLSLAMVTSVAAQVKPVQYSYSTEQSCILGGKLSSEQCANAAANARAEFEEKALRFPSRDACQRVFAASGCELGFKGAEGWAGKKSGIYFSPRQAGFRVLVSSPRDATVTPFVLGPRINFSPRSILRKDTRIDPQTAHNARDSWRAQPGAATGTFGVDTPSATGGLVPPSPPVDPNFDCASVLEPSARNHAETGCYLAPSLQR